MNPTTESTGRVQRLRRRVRRAIARKQRQTSRLSRHGLRHGLFIGGAVLVAGFALLFSWLADEALEWGHQVLDRAPWSPLLMLPFGLAALRWLTLRFAPQARGSGIPQVIAGLSLPQFDPAQSLLVSLSQAMWKIGLTTAALFIGCSVGREGPSVQVGAAVMLTWGYVLHRRLKSHPRFNAQALLTAGAAGGLAAAFNTPLAGVVFAIEELTKGMTVRWDRQVLSGVLMAGFITLSVIGNNPYFHVSQSFAFERDAWSWVLVCALVCGILGGIFSKLLLGGLPRLLPARWSALAQKHPVWSAFGCGVGLAVVCLLTHGATFGTGYDQAAALLNGHPSSSPFFGVAKFVTTVLSYFAGIPGGIFTPSLAIGAGLGEHLSLLAGPGVDTRMMALVSMAAFLAAATQAPITASVIVLEMTRSQEMTFYLMTATLVASFVSRQFSPHPFYHAAARFFRREALLATASRRRSAAAPSAPAAAASAAAAPAEATGGTGGAPTG